MSAATDPSRSTIDEHGQPVGHPAAGPAGARRPAPTVLEGEHVRLAPVDADADLPELFANGNGDAERARVWTYLGYGPFEDAEAMRPYLEGCARSEDPLFFTVHSKAHGQRVGVTSLLNVVPAHGTIEVGHIWYAPIAQRTKVNTEAVLLLGREVFEGLGYRRFEWKCNALNAASRAAARRLGFSFEGLFLNHLIVKGRNRDTAWYSMTDEEWPSRRANLERWLYGEEEGLSLAALNRPLLRPGPVDDG